MHTMQFLVCFLATLWWSVLGQGDLPLEYHILEELPPHTLIGHVSTDARLPEKYSVMELRKLRFKFLEQPDLDVSLFTIEERTGIIQTTQRIDRDKLCPHRSSCYVQLDVAVGPNQYFQQIGVRIEILDTNDNPPRFTPSQVAHQLSESSPVGTTLGLPLALDTDSQANGIQKYELLDPTNTFLLREVSSFGGATDLNLRLRIKLDRERRDFYQIRVVAHDGGTPSRSGSVLINITITDANDNDPVFNMSNYDITVTEDTPVNSVLVKLEAHDVDIGINGKVAYSFSARTKLHYGAIFNLNSTTGDLYLKSQLDYEQDKMYHLVVMATDKGVGSHPAQAQVKVRVTDVNDNSPHITVNSLTATGEPQISEGAKNNTFVAHISVADRDSGQNGMLNCHLASTQFGLIPLSKNQYKIVTAAPLDREHTNEYHLDLTCQDYGRPPRATTVDIRVTVLDENDHEPRFAQPIYSANIVENNLVNIYVVQVNATDSDSGPNGEVHYSLSPNGQGKFTINERTGVVRTAAVFDHEKSSQIRFEVFASDRGTPEARTSSTLVRVAISDINDEAPIFTQPSYSFGIFENQPPEAEVGVVTARDADSSPHNVVRYVFFPSDVTNMFKIDRMSGRIVTTRVLDREGVAVYYLSVVARNPGVPGRSTTATVSIYVADENDNSPVFDFPNNVNRSVYISSHVPVGHVITRLRAHDADIGSNARLSYILVENDHHGLFDVDSATGAVTTIETLGNIEYEVFYLTVEVRDHGFPSKSEEEELVVIVNSSIVYTHVYSPRGQSLMMSEGTMIVLAVVAAVVALLVILAIAGCLIARHRQSQRRQRTYHCKSEAQKRLLQHGYTDSRPPEGKKVASLPYVGCRGKQPLRVVTKGKPENKKTENKTGEKTPLQPIPEDIKHPKPPSRTSSLRSSEMPPVPVPGPPAPSLAYHNPRGLYGQTRYPSPAGLTSGHVNGGEELHMDHAEAVSHLGLPTKKIPQRELELLDLLREDPDAESACSVDVSNPDSGKGPSEEGDYSTAAHSDLGKVLNTSSSSTESTSNLGSSRKEDPYAQVATLQRPGPEGGVCEPGQTHSLPRQAVNGVTSFLTSPRHPAPAHSAALQASSSEAGSYCDLNTELQGMPCPRQQMDYSCNREGPPCDKSGHQFRDQTLYHPHLYEENYRNRPHITERSHTAQDKIDPQELCDEIDDLFFSDLPIKNTVV